MTDTLQPAFRRQAAVLAPGAAPLQVPAAGARSVAVLSEADEPAYKRFLGGTVLFLALGLSAISWYPIVGRISFDNVAAVAILGLAPFAWRRGARPPLLFVLLLLVIAYLFGTLLLRSEATVSFMLRPIIYTLAGCAISMIVYPRRPGLIIGAGMLAYILMFAYSAYTAQIDIINALFRGIVQLDRGWFQKFVIKATLNAFSYGDSEFATSQLNTISAFLVMSFAYMAARRRFILAAFAAALIFVLFSSSGMLSLAVLLLLIVTGSVRSRAGLFRALLAALILTSSIAYYSSEIVDYVNTNIESDSRSRDSRLNQYSRAIDQINENPIFGSGELKGETNFIHNFVFFTWASSGLIPLLILMAIYGGVSLMMLTAIYNFYTRDHEWLIIVGLLLTFLFRTLVGGGGGMPVPSSAYALGLAILEFRRLSALNPRLLAPSAHMPHQALIRTS